MEEVANDQSRTLELECDKHLDATRTLKNSEVDLLKAREDLKKMTRARDSVESGFPSAQKQAEDQIRRLLEAEDQLRIAKEQITDLKKKLVEAEGAKNVTGWAKDKALRAKEKVEFARAEAEGSKEEAQEEAYDLGVARVYRLKYLGYTGSTIPRFGMRPLNKLGLRRRPIYGRWRMYTTLLLFEKLPLLALRLRMLLRRLRLLDLKLLWL